MKKGEGEERNTRKGLLHVWDGPCLFSGHLSKTGQAEKDRNAFLDLPVLSINSLAWLVVVGVFAPELLTTTSLHQHSPNTTHFCSTTHLKLRSLCHLRPRLFCFVDKNGLLSFDFSSLAHRPPQSSEPVEPVEPPQPPQSGEPPEPPQPSWPYQPSVSLRSSESHRPPASPMLRSVNYWSWECSSQCFILPIPARVTAVKCKHAKDAMLGPYLFSYDG
eukprot:g52191.t1